MCVLNSFGAKILNLHFQVLFKASASSEPSVFISNEGLRDKSCDGYQNHALTQSHPHTPLHTILHNVSFTNIQIYMLAVRSFPKKYKYVQISNRVSTIYIFNFLKIALAMFSNSIASATITLHSVCASPQPTIRGAPWLTLVAAGGCFCYLNGAAMIEETVQLVTIHWNSHASMQKKKSKEKKKIKSKFNLLFTKFADTQLLMCRRQRRVGITNHLVPLVSGRFIRRLFVWLNSVQFTFKWHKYL